MCMQRRIALIVGTVLAAFADGFHPHGERWHLSKFFNTFSIPSPLFSSRCESQGNSPLTRPLRSQRKRRLCCRIFPFPSLKEQPLICDETTAIDFFRLFDARPAPHAFPYSGDRGNLKYAGPALASSIMKRASQLLWFDALRILAE